jgi:hypothetical protein
VEGSGIIIKFMFSSSTTNRKGTLFPDRQGQAQPQSGALPVCINDVNALQLPIETLSARLRQTDSVDHGVDASPSAPSGGRSIPPKRLPLEAEAQPRCGEKRRKKSKMHRA